MLNKKLRAVSALIVGMTMITGAHAQDGTQSLEEVVVTGSYIRSTPGDAVVPVQVMSRD